MPTERLLMRRIRDLLRLKHENGLSSRQIASALGISKGSVGSYLQRAQALGLNWPLSAELTDTALERMLFAPSVTEAERSRPMPNWAYMDQELRRPGVTRRLLWQEYRADQPDGYGYTWFCVQFDVWKQCLSPTMRQRHAAGEKVFVDYAGDTIDVIDRQTGEARAMKLLSPRSVLLPTSTAKPALARDWPTGSVVTSTCSPFSAAPPTSSSAIILSRQ